MANLKLKFLQGIHMHMHASFSWIKQLFYKAAHILSICCYFR